MFLIRSQLLQVGNWRKCEYLWTGEYLCHDWDSTADYQNRELERYLTEVRFL